MAATLTLSAWDLENVKVPTDYDPRKALIVLRHFMLQHGINMSSVAIEGVVASLSANRIRSHAIHHLCSGLDGMTLTSLNKRTKQASDRELRRKINDWVSRTNDLGSERNLILLSGDGDFLPTVELYEREFRVFVIYSHSPSRAMVNRNLSFNWNNILHSLPHLVLTPAPFFGNWGRGSFGRFGAWRGNYLGGGLIGGGGGYSGGGGGGGGGGGYGGGGGGYSGGGGGYSGGKGGYSGGKGGYRGAKGGYRGAVDADPPADVNVFTCSDAKDAKDVSPVVSSNDVVAHDATETIKRLAPFPDAMGLPEEKVTNWERLCVKLREERDKWRRKKMKMLMTTMKKFPLAKGL